MIFSFQFKFLTMAAQEGIRQIDFAALKRAGYRGAVFDKDNCLVLDISILRAQFMPYNNNRPCHTEIPSFRSSRFVSSSHPLGTILTSMRLEIMGNLP
jgi:hypothetical protein